MRTASALANFIAALPHVTRIYPHEVGPMSLALHQDDRRRHDGVVRSGGRRGRRIPLGNALKLRICISNNLGDAKSIVTHPATTSQRLTPEARAELGIRRACCGCRWGWSMPTTSRPTSGRLPKQ